VYIIFSLHGGGPFLRNGYLPSWSKIYPTFVEPVGLPLCSQEPTNRPYPEPVESCPHPQIFKDTCSYYTPSMGGSLKWPFLLKDSWQTLYTFLICTLHVTCPTHHILLDWLP